MKLHRFVQILAITLALAGYSAWVASERPRGPVTTDATESVLTTRIPLIRTTEAEALWRHNTTLFVDVRSNEEYAQGHIAGALHLTEEDLDRRLPELLPRLRRAGAVVVYCKSRDCGKSLWAALRLEQEGLTRVHIYPAGWNEWYLRGLPTERGAGR